MKSYNCDSIPVLFAVMQTGKRANGGVESITQILQNLRNIRPIVVTQRETDATARWRDSGSEVHVWPLPYSMGSRFTAGGLRAQSRRVLSLIRTNAAAASLIRRSGVKVVHCNDELAMWHVAGGARAAGAAVVQNIRGIKSELDAYGFRWRLATRLSSHTLFLSREMSEAFRRRLRTEAGSARLPENSFIYSVVNPQRFAMTSAERLQTRRRLGIGDGQFAVGYVAAFNRKKLQYEFLKQAAARIRDRVPQGHVYFLGDFDPEADEYARSCAELVTQQALKNVVTFTGYQADMPLWYQSLDAVVVASQNEGLARCMIESLAAGTPVISFDVCSAAEILLEHDCGIVIRQGDYAGLTESLRSLAVDAQQRDRLACNGAAMARQLFNPESIVSQYENLYRRLHANKSRRQAA